MRAPIIRGAAYAIAVFWDKFVHTYVRESVHRRVFGDAREYVTWTNPASEIRSVASRPPGEAPLVV
jgi:hypothetical protein